MSVEEKLRGIRPKSFVYLYSGGKDSSLALLLTRDLVRGLADELGSKVYMLYVVIPGNTHPLNTFAASAVMEWHRKNYGFEPLYRCRPKVFQELAAKYGLEKGEGRWCYVEFKNKVFREVEKELPRPQLHVDGMSPKDSSARKEKIRAELEYVETQEGTRYYVWHPLFSLDLSDGEKLQLLRRHEEFWPVVRLYEEFGDSLNCVVCPYKSRSKMMRHHAAEDLSALYRFAEECLRSRKWKKMFSALANRPLSRFLPAL